MRARWLPLLLVARLGAAAPPPPAAPAAPAPPNPVLERAQAIAEASSLLQKAEAARARGNKNFAEQLFSSAELLVGAEALADVAPLFRAGAPPRINTPLKPADKAAAPQPIAAGGSDDEDKVVERPKRGALAGVVKLGEKPLDGRAVVTLQLVGKKPHNRPPRTRTMEQRNREFAPKVLVVPVGSTVVFPNFDTVYHNVFSRSEAMEFDLGLYKNGQSRELTFDKEGIVRIGCNLHANMSAYIAVTSAPHYAISDDRGAFRFKSLEPGKYTLRVYSERSLQPATQEVTIVADKTGQVTVSAAADAPAPVDKFGAPRGR
jgi:plastocyanin